MGIKVFGVVYMLYCNYICKDEYEDGVIQDFEFKGFVLVFLSSIFFFFFFFQAEDGIRDKLVTGVQTCALPIFAAHPFEVPQSFVEQQTNQRLQAVVREMMGRGVDPRNPDMNWEGAREELQGQIGRASCRERV